MTPDLRDAVVEEVERLRAEVDRLTAALAAREASEHGRITAAVREALSTGWAGYAAAFGSPPHVNTPMHVYDYEVDPIVRRHLAETDDERAVREARAAVVEAARDPALDLAAIGTTAFDDAAAVMRVRAAALRAAEAALAKGGR